MPASAGHPSDEFLRCLKQVMKTYGQGTGVSVCCRLMTVSDFEPRVSAT
jgi:hypothetical protein